MDMKLDGKKVEPRLWELNHGWDGTSGSFAFNPTDPMPALGTEVTVDLGGGTDYTGHIVAMRSYSGGYEFDVSFDPAITFRSAVSSGTFDPTILPPGITATTGTGHKITGPFTSSASFGIPLKPTFVYGDVIRWKITGRKSDDERFMVIGEADSDGWINVVPVDPEGGEPEAVWADNFEKVEDMTITWNASGIITSIT